jgi:hypothetical protein
MCMQALLSAKRQKSRRLGSCGAGRRDADDECGCMINFGLGCSPLGLVLQSADVVIV